MSTFGANLIGPARRAGLSAYPALWSGCASLWAPCLARTSQATWTLRSQPVPDLGYRRLGARRSGGGTNATTPLGYGLNFTGAGGGFVVPNSSAGYSFVHQSARFSLLAVLRSDNITAAGTLLDSTLLTSSNSGFSFYQDASGKMSYFVTRSAGGSPVVTGSTSSALSVGRWNVVVVTCDGTTGRIWLAGKRDGSDASVGTLGTGNASYDLGFGCAGGGANSSVFNGTIALLGIWDRPLAAAQVRRLSSDPLCMFRRRRDVFAAGPMFRPWFKRPHSLCGGVA